MAEAAEKTPDVTELSIIDEKLARVSCPFTWGMKIGWDSVETETMLETKEEIFQIVLDRQDFFPEMVLMYYLLMAHKHASLNDLPKAVESITNAELFLGDIKEKATLKNVEAVLDHIFIGSKCHVLKLEGRLVEAEELLEGIVAVPNMNKLELGMLSGCKCSAWSLYNNTDGVGMTCAKEAVELDPNNGKWYFLLGQTHRELRKVLYSTVRQPGAEETAAFEKAYALSPNVLFGVSVAQLYRESLDYEMATKIYKEVHALQPTCVTVRLQLALGFIRARECELAKECLDYVAERNFIFSRYNHYMGIYEEKCNRNFKAALPYYESTIKNLNWAAEYQYSNCKKKVEPDWDPLPQMLSLLEKYKGYPDHIIQDINIRIGSYYLFQLKDIPAACEYLLDAMKLEPNSNRLKEHWVSCRKIQVDLYQVLANEIQTVLRDPAAKHDDSTVALLKDTQRLCNINCKYVPPHRALSISGSSSSHSLRNYQTRGQGFSSSYPGTSGRIERPRPSSSQWRSDYPRGNEHRPAYNFRDDFRRGSDASLIISWRSRDRKDKNVEDATCELVKSVKDLRM